MTVSLTALDQPNIVHPPKYPLPVTADANDFATVFYLPVTASENPTGESDTIIPDCFPVGPGPTSATSDNGFVTSGSFPVGVTTLFCTATDNVDGQPIQATESAYLKVTVADQPVTVTVPPTQLAQATSSSGATVSYSPVAAEDGEAAEIAGYCSADKSVASSADGFVTGGNFPVGGTTLTCYATDLVDGPSLGSQQPPESFTVIVTKTPCAALAGCNLHGLDLSNAILVGADTSGADLSNANLNKADLSNAILVGADLSGANLNRVDLTGADLTGANTTGANFNMVTWNNTTCPDGTNSNASNPETCVGHL